MKQISKKVNLLFLAVAVLHVAASILLSMLLLRSFSVNLAVQFIISELTILIPGFIFLLVNNCRLGEWLPFHRMKWGSAGMVILFAYLIMPFISFINVFSQLFTENAVLGMNEEIMSMPPLLMIFIIGVFGPFCEEFVFRGIIFQGYKKAGSLLGAMVLSSLLFGLLHMNFNQFCYACVLGFFFALLTEVTGSLWSSVIAHMIVNTHNVVMLFGVQKLYSKIGIDINQVYEEGMTFDAMLYTLGLLLVLSVIFTALAAAVLIALCKMNGTEAHVRSIFMRNESKIGKEDEKKHRLLSVSGVLGIAVCLFVMFGLDSLMTFLGR